MGEPLIPASEGPCARAPVFTVAVLVLIYLVSPKNLTLIFCLGRIGVNIWLPGVLCSGLRHLEGRYQPIVEDFESVYLFQLCLSPVLTGPGVSQSGAFGALIGGQPLHTAAPPALLWAACFLCPQLTSLCSRNLSASFPFPFSWLWSRTLIVSMKC